MLVNLTTSQVETFFDEMKYIERQLKALDVPVVDIERSIYRSSKHPFPERPGQSVAEPH